MQESVGHGAKMGRTEFQKCGLARHIPALVQDGLDEQMLDRQSAESRGNCQNVGTVGAKKVVHRINQEEQQGMQNRNPGCP